MKGEQLLEQTKKDEALFHQPEENNISRYTDEDKWIIADLFAYLTQESIMEFSVNYGTRVLTPFYETMLRYISIGDYVYAGSVERGGIVDEIIKDTDGFPLCVKIKCDKDTRERYKTDYDYISIDRILYWNRWKEYRPMFSKEELWDEDCFSILEIDIRILEENGDLL